MYVLAYIDKTGSIRISEPDPDSEGYCYAHPEHKCAHRESIGIDTWVENVYEKLDEGKKAYLENYENTSGVPILLHLNKEGAGDAIWVSPDDRPEADIRLKIWHSCYGGWTVKEFNV